MGNKLKDLPSEVTVERIGDSDMATLSVDGERPLSKVTLVKPLPDAIKVTKLDRYRSMVQYFNRQLEKAGEKQPIE